jgi:hypothetical protein
MATYILHIIYTNGGPNCGNLLFLSFYAWQVELNMIDSKRAKVY